MLYRCIQQNPMWHEKPFSRGQAWVDLLMLANFADNFLMKRGIKVIVKRGQVGWSERNLAERWGWSRGKIRRFLNDLKTEQQIEPQNEPQNLNVTSLITITNYDRYQSRKPQNEPQNEPQTVPQTVPLRINKEVKTLNPIASNKSSQPEQTISFDFSTGIFSNLHDHREAWSRAYPAVDIDVEVSKAAAWLLANPKNRKKNYPRFLNLWLSKAQDRAPRQQQSQTLPSIDPATHITPAQSAGIRQVLERRQANA